MMSGWLDPMEIYWLVKPCYYNLRNSHSIVNKFLYTLDLCPQCFHLFLFLPLASITEKLALSLTWLFTLLSRVYFLPHFSFTSKSPVGPILIAFSPRCLRPFLHCFSPSKFNYLSSLKTHIRLSPSLHLCSVIHQLSSYFSAFWRFWSQK